MPTRTISPCPTRVYDAKPPLDHIRQFLRQECDRQGLGVEALAALVGTSKTHLNDFINGKRDMTLGRFLRLLNTLGVAMPEVCPPEGPSVLARIVLQLHARGPTFCERQLALLEATPDCLPRRRA